MKYIISVFKILLMTLVTLAAIAGVLFFLLLEKPEIFLNPKTLQLAAVWGAARLSEQGIQLHWKTIDVNVQSESFSDKTIRVQVSEPCAEQFEKWRACFSSLGLTAKIHLFAAPSKLIEVGSLDLQGGKVKLLSPDGIKNAQLDARIRELSFNQYQLRLQFVLNRPSPGVKKLESRNCELNIKRTSLQFEFDEAHLSCPLTLAAENFPSGIFRSTIEPPERLKILIELQAKGGLLPFQGQAPVEVHLRTTLQPFSAGSIHGHATATTDFLGRFSELRQPGHLSVRANADLEVSRFQELTAHLEHTPFAVPAPFHALNGDLRIQVNAEADSLFQNIYFSTETHLNSPTQRFGTRSVGNAEFSRDDPGHLSATVFFSDVLLELPRFDLAAPPRLLPDPRISPNEKDQSDIRKFTFHISLKSLPEHPILIKTNLASAPVPIDLDLQLGNTGPIAGRLNIKSFPMQLFRRGTTVDHINLSLNDPTSNSVIDGLLYLKYSDYLIYVKIAATLGSPVIRISSDPPLPEDQLISTLLFGQSIDELDPNQAASVGSTRSALADGVIGLTSFYVLASTPVEAVTYDSATHILAARLRLGAGTSLSIGTGPAELAELGFRKRIGHHWTLETDLTKLNPNESSTVATFLEWSNRY